MIKALINSTNTIRVETEEDADQLHKDLQQEAEKLGCVLSTFTKTLKEKKSKGEVMESWYIVKYVFTFNDAKDPVTYLKSIEYNMTDVEQEDMPWEM